MVMGMGIGPMQGKGIGPQLDLDDEELDTRQMLVYTSIVVGVVGIGLVLALVVRMT